MPSESQHTPGPLVNDRIVPLHGSMVVPVGGSFDAYLKVKANNPFGYEWKIVAEGLPTEEAASAAIKSAKGE